jgi:hypothetical protein
VATEEEVQVRVGAPVLVGSPSWLFFVCSSRALEAASTRDINKHLSPLVLSAAAAAPLWLLRGVLDDEDTDVMLGMVVVFLLAVAL